MSPTLIHASCNGNVRASLGDFGSGYPSDPYTVAWLAAHRATAIERKVLRTKWNLKTA